MVRVLAPADHHQHPALGVELDEHVGAFVDRPDVVLGVDAHRVGEREAVVVAADLADEGALRRVLEEPRLVGAVVDVDVALGVGGDAHVLADVDPRRVLEEVGHRLVRNHRHVGGGGARLRGERRDSSATPHWRVRARLRRTATDASYARSSKRPGPTDEPRNRRTRGSRRALYYGVQGSDKAAGNSRDTSRRHTRRRRSGGRMRRMPTVWDPPVRADLVRRVQTLTPAHSARWGRFSGAAMVAHLNEATRMALGELRRAGQGAAVPAPGASALPAHPRAADAT